VGEHIINTHISTEIRTAFIGHLLNDIRALEKMLEENLIEDDIIRVGSEQEFCLVNKNWRPSKNASEILKAISDPHFTTELARFNLEINLDPVELKGNCFSQVETQLTDLMAKAKAACRKYDTKTVLTGILPTISMNELEFEYMTQNPRYWIINDIMKEMRGGDFELHIRGIDELSINHDSVLFEACNTSFQMHLQIPPDDFVSSYNWAQAISGPLLGVCANSPILLGRELWSETRIALFRQSIDLQSSSYALKDKMPRVSFGNSWATGSVAEVFKDNISRYKIILAKDLKTKSLDVLEQGGIPKLEAMNLHNGTIYRWNRPCYGVGNGKPHVRIENRYIPAGPTLIDELANFAFWVGMMMGRPAKFNDMPAVMDFRDAKSNFIKAARTGKESVLNWCGKLISVRDLVIDELLPIAREGLQKSQIDPEDGRRLLDIIEQRTKGITGAQWKVRNYRKLCSKLKQDDALLALTKAIHDNQSANIPVHQWPMLSSDPEIHESAREVSHVMSTQLFTVNENDLAELATTIMQWNNIHHVPVENNSGDLCGILTWTHMKRFVEKKGHKEKMIVKDIMATQLLTANPDTEIQVAIKLMKKHEVGCLPVVKENHLVGIITIADVIQFDYD
jgi:CBS domain-containing protein